MSAVSRDTIATLRAELRELRAENEALKEKARLEACIDQCKHLEREAWLEYQRKYGFLPKEGA